MSVSSIPVAGRLPIERWRAASLIGGGVLLASAIFKILGLAENAPVPSGAWWLEPWFVVSLVFCEGVLGIGLLIDGARSWLFAGAVLFAVFGCFSTWLWWRAEEN